MQNYIQESLTATNATEPVSGNNLMGGSAEAVYDGIATFQIITGSASAYIIHLQAQTVPIDTGSATEAERGRAWSTIGTFTATDDKLVTFRISRRVDYRVLYVSGSNTDITVRVRG